MAGSDKRCLMSGCACCTVWSERVKLHRANLASALERIHALETALLKERHKTEQMELDHDISG